LYCSEAQFQTSQTGGQSYNDNSPLSVPCFSLTETLFETKRALIIEGHICITYSVIDTAVLVMIKGICIM